MSMSILKTLLLTTTYLGCSTFSFGQHSQDVHDKLVDDFYTPFLFTLQARQTFSGSIGELKWQDGGDLWDFYVFQSPGAGEIDIVLDDFNRPVNLSLESSFPEPHNKPEALAESYNRFMDSHRITAKLSPLKTYYIAVGTGVPDNGYTPYTLKVKFREARVDSQPASTVEKGKYELSFSSKPCAVPEFDTDNFNLPMYVVSVQGAEPSTRSATEGKVNKRTHEMFHFDPSSGMLFHEFSDVISDEGSEGSLQRDVVVVGNFEGDEFHGELREHRVAESMSKEFGKTTGNCSRQVTSIGQ